MKRKTITIPAAGLLTIEQVAAYTQTTRRAVEGWIANTASNGFPVRRLGQAGKGKRPRIRIDRDELDAWTRGERKAA